MKNMISVLYSPQYGAGWYSWNQGFENCLFNLELVELVKKKELLEKEKQDTTQIIKEIENKAESLYSDEFYAGGARSLRIEQMPEGTLFNIKEYDGFESIEYCEDKQWLVAKKLL